MNENSKTIAVLDACVLYSAMMRDILLNLAEQGIYEPKWSKTIENEWLRNLLKNRPDLKEENLKRTIRFMNQKFKDANVTDFDHHIPTIQLPDLDDRHVLACAIQCEAEIIVTTNLKDFPPDELAKFNIIPQHPDDFICDLFKRKKEAAITALNVQLEKLKNPPRTKEELLETFKKQGLPKAAELFK